MVMKRNFNDGTSGSLYTESSAKTASFALKKFRGETLPVNNYTFRGMTFTNPAVNVSQTSTPNWIRLNPSQKVNAAIQSGSVTMWDRDAPGPYGEQNIKTITKAAETPRLDLCTPKLLSKVRNTQIDLGVAMGEYKETSKFITSAILKTAKSYFQLRRGDVSGALSTVTGRKNREYRDVPLTASSAWLAYSYAIRPLISDVNGAIEQLDQGYRKAGPHLTKIRSGRNFSTSEGSYGQASVWAREPAAAGQPPNPYRLYPSVTQGEIVQYTGSAVAVAVYRVDNPLTATLDQVGLTNPLNVAWELVPFSFVVDWFLPVGDYLQSIVPPQGVTLVSGYTYVKVKGHTETFTYQAARPGYPKATFQTMTTDEVIKLRVKVGSWSSFPTTKLDATFALTGNQTASAFALLTQAFLSGKRPRPVVHRTPSGRHTKWPNEPWYSR
jgi:hypothetical protein